MPDRHPRIRTSKVTVVEDSQKNKHHLGSIVHITEVYGSPSVHAALPEQKTYDELDLQVKPITPVAASSTQVVVEGTILQKDNVTFTLKYWDFDSTSWDIPVTPTNPDFPLPTASPYHWKVTFDTPSGGANNYTFEISATWTVSNASTPPTTVTTTVDVSTLFTITP